MPKKSLNYFKCMEFLKDKEYFDIEDIKKWLNDGK
jgi:hypothetical protein